MLWHALPPELNTARLMAGAGPGPMLQAAAGWEALGGALETQAAELAATLVALKEAWTGAGSERAIAAATPMVAWLQDAAQQAQQRGARATAQAAAYMKALGVTPSLPDIAANHITRAVLTATNFLGINMVPIGLNETDYFVRMWNQAAGAMDVYQAETAANPVFEPLPPMKPILAPEVGEAVSAAAVSRLSEMAAQAAPATLSGLGAMADEVPAPAIGAPLAEEALGLLTQMGQLGQLSGPMQQLMMPLQQLTSLAGQAGGMGGGAGLGGEGPGGLDGQAEGDLGQLGLLGASPLSNHPLAGGSGPSVGMGLMHAEALPGAGGSSARTALMTQLIDKPAQMAGPAAAGAGSSAVGGAAPMGMMGAGSAGGGGARPGLAAPALAAQDHADDVHDDLDDGGDW